MPQALYVVDAFTDRPFQGNPAAVCLLDAAASTSWMLQVSREMNLAETAFIVPHGNEFELRWFTPTTEVDLCGHATLASAFVLWHKNHISLESEARFLTRSGLLTCKRNGDLISMNFPATPVLESNEIEPLVRESIERALGCKAVFIGTNGMDFLIEVENQDELLHLRPDLHALSQIQTRGFIVTCRCTEDERWQDADFLSRFFAPGVGVPEDPVTGSAHCTLGPYWSSRIGRDRLLGYQASARGGSVEVRCLGERVALLGQAVLMSRVELYSTPGM
ncbi:PhzF family phenazine biosynthesis protein [Pirellulaceae bacterium SH501]